MVTNLPKEYFLPKSSFLYGIILRSLSYRHSDEFNLKMIKMLGILLKYEIFAESFLTHLFTFIIFKLNKIKDDVSYYSELNSFGHKLIV